MDRRLPHPAPEGFSLTRCSGVVAWFSADRGFGFVAPDDDSENVFVTWSALPGRGFRRVDAGQRVTFTRDIDLHGPTARNVEFVAG